MKKTYQTPSLQVLVVEIESQLLIGSPEVSMSSQSASTTNGEYDTLSRENSSSFDDEE